MNTKQKEQINDIFNELDDAEMSTARLLELTAQTVVAHGIMSKCDAGDIAEALKNHEHSKQ